MFCRCADALLWPWMSLILCVAVSQANAKIVDYNTTIDYAVNDEDVTIIEGTNPSPPTVVQIVQPADLDQQLLVYDSSIVHLSGGEIDEWLHAHNAATVNISGGWIGEDVVAHDTSTVNVFGGELSDYANAQGSSMVNIFGGTVWGVEARGQSSVHVSGGFIRAWPQEYALFADQSGTITIRGTGFNYPYGRIPDAFGTLTGFLASGESIQAGFEIHADGSIVLVPEPAAMLLACAAGLAGSACLLRRRKRPARQPS